MFDTKEFTLKERGDKTSKWFKLVKTLIYNLFLKKGGSRPSADRKIYIQINDICNKRNIQNVLNGRSNRKKM